MAKKTGDPGSSFVARIATWMLIAVSARNTSHIAAPSRPLTSPGHAGDQIADDRSPDGEDAAMTIAGHFRLDRTVKLRGAGWALIERPPGSGRRRSARGRRACAATWAAG